MTPAKPGRVVSFGPFELDTLSGELRKHGLRIRLAGQPLQILLMLLAHPGQLVTRDQIRQRLWTNDTFVDFDAGLSSAVRKVREALGDSADNPRFIETLPKRGYRFVAPVEDVRPATRGGTMTPPADAGAASVIAPAAPPVAAAAGARPVFTVSRALLLAGSLLVVGAAGFIFGRTPASVATASRAAAAPNHVDAQAYDLYLKGVAAYGRGGTAGFRNAVSYLEAAVGKQPDFALAYATLAHAQLQLIYSGSIAPKEVVPKAEQWARKAIELDGANALAHRTLGGILQIYYWKRDEARREIETARQADPDSVDAHLETAWAFVRDGRFREARAESEQARKADPLSFGAALNLGALLRAAQLYELAIAEFQRGLAINPTSPRGHFQLGITYVSVGRWREAIDELQTAIRLTPENMRFEAYLGYAYVMAGRRDDAIRTVKEMKARAAGQYVSGFGIALVEDALGDRPPALADLERAFADHAIEFSQLNQYPEFRTIASEPRFADIMRQVGHAPQPPR